jgi:hypothetical protein
MAASKFLEVNTSKLTGKPMPPNPTELLELRHRLRLLRIYLASLNSIELIDVDSLLHVAEAELDRLAISYPRTSPAS